MVDELKEFVYNTRVYTEKWNLNRITWYSVFEQLDDANVSRQSVEKFLFNWNLRRYTAFAETDAAQRILEKIRNTLRSQQLDITSI